MKPENFLYSGNAQLVALAFFTILTIVFIVMRVLICDDIEVDRHMISWVLRKHDPLTIIIEATTCNEAKAAKDQVDVIVMDQVLIGSTGVQCLKDIRGSGFRGAFIIVTGYNDDKVSIEALHNGADNFILKTAMFEELVPAIIRALDLRAESIRTSTEVLKQKNEISSINEQLAKIENKLRNGDRKNDDLKDSDKNSNKDCD